MDRRERIESQQDALLVALEGWQSSMWTAMPAIIQSFDPVSMTCEAQPTIQAKFTSPVDGSVSWMSLPLLSDCPVFFPSGGNCTLTFPIKADDECLIVFASRCIDSWWNSGKVDGQAMLRMHDLSDGFVFAGVRSRPHWLSGVSTTTVQLRSDDGQAFIEINPTSHLINASTPGAITAECATAHVTASASVTIDAPSTTVNSTTAIVNAATTTINATTAAVNASASATITSPAISLKNAGTSLKKLVNETFITFFNSHVHSGVITGGGSTGAPTSTPASSTTTSIVQAE
jgi:hypothetical protein